MNALETSGGHLRRALGERSLSLEDLTSQIEESFGSVEAAIVTGSLVAGYGNKGSDLDIQVIVDCPTVGSMPFMSFAKGFLVDVEYFARPAIEGTTSLVKTGEWPRRGPSSPEEWSRYRRATIKLSRFATGELAISRGLWREWHSDLRSGWLEGRIVAWHRSEVARLKLCGDWLFDDAPLVACHRYCSAVLAACEARVGDAGEIYQDRTGKWTPDKLRRTGLLAEYRLLRQALRTPGRPADCAAYRETCLSAIVDVLGSPIVFDGLEAQLWLGSSASAYAMNGGTLLTKIGLRGIDVTGWRPEEGGDGKAPLLRLPPTSPLPEPYRTLLREDWLWIALASREAR